MTLQKVYSDWIRKKQKKKGISWCNIQAILLWPNKTNMMEHQMLVVLKPRLGLETNV